MVGTGLTTREGCKRERTPEYVVTYRNERLLGMLDAISLQEDGHIQVDPDTSNTNESKDEQMCRILKVPEIDTHALIFLRYLCKTKLKNALQEPCSPVIKKKIESPASYT